MKKPAHMNRLLALEVVDKCLLSGWVMNGILTIITLFHALFSSAKWWRRNGIAIAVLRRPDYAARNERGDGKWNYRNVIISSDGDDDHGGIKSEQE
jgi:hypothetical protein